MQRETVRRGDGFHFDEDRVQAIDRVGRVLHHPPVPDVTEIVSAVISLRRSLIKPESKRLQASAPGDRIAGRRLDGWCPGLRRWLSGSHRHPGACSSSVAGVRGPRLNLCFNLFVTRA